MTASDAPRRPRRSAPSTAPSAERPTAPVAEPAALPAPPAAAPTGSSVQTPAEPSVDDVLDAVGPRLRALRRERGATLAQLSATTGISVSTLSRLESGQRRPTLELLLPLARAHQVPLEDLVDAPPTGDPRVRSQAVVRHGMTMIPLTRRPGGMRSYKWIVPAGAAAGEPEQKSHEGYEWLYVLSGRLRLLLGEHDLVLTEGEVAEFDTRTPHWFGNAGTVPAELLVLFGPQGERMHLRARSTPSRRTAPAAAPRA